MRILAFGTSNNSPSINRSLAVYAAQLLQGAELEVLDINDYELPIFSDAREQALGRPARALAFSQKIAAADALVISYAEHNGTYSAAWKNLFDWTSRLDRAVFQNKLAVYLATSPGPGGAANVLAQALGSARFFGAEVIASQSVPSFYDNFDPADARMTNTALREELERAMQLLEQAVAKRVEKQRSAA